jgi:nicotinamidase-related amidase
VARTATARPITTELLRACALVINEVQNGMTDPALADNPALALECERRGVIGKIAHLATVCRELGVPVIHNTIVMRPDRLGTSATCLLLGSLRKKGRLIQGDPAAEIHPAVTPRPSDYVIERVNGLTPFHGTNLEEILRAEGIATVILTGVSTNVGIPGACLEAVNRSMHAIVPQDCIAASFPEAQEFQVTHTLPLLATVTDSPDLIRQLRDAHR